MHITTTNPATGAVLKEYAVHSEADIEAIIAATAGAAQAWARRSPSDRVECLRALARVLRIRTPELATLITLEMGKPIRQSRAEIAKCALLCDYYAEHGPAFLADEEVKTEASRSVVAFEPLGVVLAVMPWNFPFWQVLRCAVPALLAGNGVLLKHASNVCGCGLEIEGVLREAGFPEDLFRTLVIPSGAVGTVLEHPRVRAVSLTGSEAAGRAIASGAGAQLKKTVLELGGSDPYLVLADADLDLAAAKCTASRFNNGGQTCIAAKRFIVVPEVREAFAHKLIEAVGKLRVGDPTDETMDIGPLARADLRDELHDQVRRSLAMGARLVHQGSVSGLAPDGAWFSPTILAEVTPDMPAAREELFGPVAVIMPASSEEDAIRMANDTDFGLGAAVFSRDLARAESIARRLQAGSVFINDFVRSDPRLPFGGVKNSGFGRELARYGLLEFVNLKSLVVAG